MFQFLNDSQRKNLYNAFFALVILLAVFVGVKAVNAFKEYSYIGRGTYAANVITVTGKGEVIAMPDTGSFSFSVVEEGKTVKEAQDKAATKMNTIIPALKAMGVDEKDIQTTGYSSYPKYEYGQTVCPVGGYCSGKQTLVGYEVSQTIGVKVRKTADAGAALSKVGELGASNISGLDFIIDKPDVVQAQARDKAIADAKSKADALSKSLGIKLNKIVNFYEVGNQPPIYYDKANSTMGMAVATPSVVPEVPTGQNTITSQVSITYEVQQ